MNSADPQLRKISVSIMKDDGIGGFTGVLGTLNISITANGVGKARLWKDALKTAEFEPLQVKFGGTAWIKGTHESRPEHDVVVNIDFTPADADGANGTHIALSVSITPVVNDLSILAATAPNIEFQNNQNAIDGLQARHSTPYSPGATFSARVIDSEIYQAGSASEKMDYIQNITNIENGPNRGVANAGWVYSDGTPSKRLALINGAQLPLLDSDAGDAPYFHQAPVRICTFRKNLKAPSLAK